MNAMAAVLDDSSWFEVGHLDDIPRRGARQVQIGQLTIGIFRTIDDRLFALEDRCPHKGGPLSQGIVHDGCVTCPLHNWVIALDSGAATGADQGRVKRYPLRLDGDKILLSITAHGEGLVDDY